MGSDENLIQITRRRRTIEKLLAQMLGRRTIDQEGGPSNVTKKILSWLRER